MGMSFGEGDTFLPVVPMFHANAWGYPYLAASLGAKIVYPGPLLDPHSLLEDFEQERVTWAAGVPTIWMGILNVLDAEPDRYDLSGMKGMLVGGSAAPRALIAGFKQRHGIAICHGWGMTETSPVASVTDLPGDLADADEETKFDFVALQGIPLPFVEIRARDVEGNLIAWDGEAMGELECRGPWVAASYYDTPEQADRWTEDGWFCTGDIVSIDERGFIAIKDRSKDVIKSGGEWISSVDLECELMAHPAVAEAAVIAIPDEKWTERPLAVVVLKPGEQATGEELREFLGKLLRQVVAAGPVRVHRRDPEDGGRQVPQDRAARDVRRGRGAGRKGQVTVTTRQRQSPTWGSGAGDCRGAGPLGRARVLKELGQSHVRKRVLLAADVEHGLAVDDAGVGRHPVLADDGRRAHGVALASGVWMTMLSPGPPSRSVDARAADEDVVAVAADEGVVAGAADQDVVAVAAVHRHELIAVGRQPGRLDHVVTGQALTVSRSLPPPRR